MSTSRQLLFTLVFGFLVAGCPYQIQTRYVPTVAPAPQAIRTMQVGTFLGEELYEISPMIIAESGKFGIYRLPVPAPEFLRDALLAELEARGIGVSAEAKRVAGELMRFEFPCEEQSDDPPVVRCTMRFRFTLRDRGRTVFEKTYEQSVSIRAPDDRPEGELAGRAFMQLLARVYSAFLEDPVVAAQFAAASPGPSSAGDQPTEDSLSAAEGRGLHRKLKNNRIYFEMFGRSLMGIYYDRKVFEYGYVGLGTDMIPPMHPGPDDPNNPRDPNRPIGNGGIWGDLFVGVNSPNLFRNRLFAEFGVQKVLVGLAKPSVTLNFTLGYAFQFPAGFDLQIGCTHFIPNRYSLLCAPRFDFGKAF